MIATVSRTWLTNYIQQNNIQLSKIEYMRAIMKGTPLLNINGVKQVKVDYSRYGESHYHLTFNDEKYYNWFILQL